MRRVVVTGLGMVTPLGCGVATNWDRLIRGENGIRLIESFDVSDLTCKVAGQVPRPDSSNDSPADSPENLAKGAFNADDWVPRPEQRRMDEFIVFALAAAAQAIEDSGWETKDEEEKTRAGVMVGSGIGGLSSIYDNSIILKEKGPRRISPFFIPSALINLASGHISIKHGLKGPNHAVVTACSTGAHAIGDAARLIQADEADLMVAGGAEAAVCRLGIAGFAAARALSTKFNDTPEKASRPWDRARDGFVMGARGFSCLRRKSTQKHEARRSMPRSRAMGCRGMHTTSRRRPRMVMAATAQCGTRWRVPT